MEKMNKSIIIFATLLFMSLCSCSSGSKQTAARVDGIEIDSIVRDSIVALTSDADAPKCEVRLSIQYVKGKNAAKINHAILNAGLLAPDYLFIGDKAIGIKQTVDSFIVKYFSDYKKDYAVLYRADRQHRELYNCYYKLRTSTISEREGVLTYIAHISNYGGGAHESRQTIAKNIDVNTGRILSLDDMFIHGYKDKLMNLIVKKLCERFGVEDLDGLSTKMIFADGNAYIPDNFIIGKDKLTFIYCEDEIAPHEIGEIRVDIDNDDLGKLLKS